jgi:hypothetical protein
MCSKGVLRIHAVDQAMKIVRSKGAEVRCERCDKETNTTIGSFFDTKIICIECRNLEEKHPQYAAAKLAEQSHVAKGNYNFEGIGLPTDWPIYAMAHSLGGSFVNGEYVFPDQPKADEFAKYAVQNGKNTLAGSKKFSFLVN